MLRIILLTASLFQPHTPVGAVQGQVDTQARSSIIAEPSGTPFRNFWIIHYDDSFLFAARHFGDARDRGGNTEPGLFVHSRAHSRWIKILQISTAGGRFGRSSWPGRLENGETRPPAAVAWDFTHYSERPYIEQPLRTSGSIVFPEMITYDPSTDQYELRYLASWGPSAETVLYVRRRDLVSVLEAQQ